ncbi:hypothetical protein YC2023_020720 [Brassica napus]
MEVENLHVKIRLYFLEQTIDDHTFVFLRILLESDDDFDIYCITKTHLLPIRERRSAPNPTHT